MYSTVSFQINFELSFSSVPKKTNTYFADDVIEQRKKDKKQA